MKKLPTTSWNADKRFQLISEIDRLYTGTYIYKVSLHASFVEIYLPSLSHTQLTTLPMKEYLSAIFPLNSELILRWEFDEG